MRGAQDYPRTRTFDIVVPNLRSEVLTNLEQDAESYGKIVCGVAFDPALVDCTPESGWTVKAAGLPAGLKWDAKTGRITGVPTKAGTFTVTFTAAKRGEKNQTATITLNVEAAPDWAIGTFTGWCRGMGNGERGTGNGEWGTGNGEWGTASMTVAANGKVSGKIAIDGTNWTLKADSYAAVECKMSGGGGYETNFVVNAVATAGKMKRAMELRVASADGGRAGRATLSGLANAKAEGATEDGEWSAAMWRGMWKDKATAVVAKEEIANWVGVYTVSLASGADYGCGYLSLTVGKDGNVKAAGKLADGTSVSAASPLMYGDGGYLAYFYAAPGAYKGGAFALAVGFGDADARDARPCLGGPSQWTSRNPQATGEYGAGFRREVEFTGAYYDKLETLREHYEALRVSLDGGQSGSGTLPTLGYVHKQTYLNDLGRKATDIENREAEAVDTLDDAGLVARIDASGKIVVEKATRPVQDKETKAWHYDGANDGALTLTFAQATGIFKGSYTFWYDYESAYDATKAKDNATMAHVSKKVNFEGIVVQGEGRQRGFYLWDATGAYWDEKTRKEKTYKYKESFPVWLNGE